MCREAVMSVQGGLWSCDDLKKAWAGGYHLVISIVLVMPRFYQVRASKDLQSFATKSMVMM